MTQLSAHFTLAEFACKCGRWPRCTAVRPSATLVAALETARARHYPQGLVILSGVRDARYNLSVGGASKSQHCKGTAVDLRDQVMTIRQAIACGFRGVGVYRHDDGWRVSHVDVRPGPVAVWQYPSRAPVPRSEWT